MSKGIKGGRPASYAHRLTRNLCAKLGPSICPEHGGPEGLCIAGDQPCRLHSEVDVKEAIPVREARLDKAGATPPKR